MPPALRAALLAAAAASAAASATGPTVFAAISDWGGTGAAPFTTPSQLAVAAALGSVATANSAEFVLSAGNNFLPNGLPMGGSKSVQTQARLAATWTDVYTSPGLQVPWYVVAGYADWLGNATAERAFTTGTSSRWQYPSLWHSVNVLVPPNYATLQIVMLDTVTLAGAMFNNPGAHTIPAGVSTDAAAGGAPPAATGAQAEAAATVAAAALAASDAAARTAGGAEAPAPGPAPASRRGLRARAAAAIQRPHRPRRSLSDFNTNYNPPISQLQWQWLAQFLNASTADWLIVVGNDPIWSAGEHGPTWALADTLLPLLQAAGVSLYISGRDPVPQHFTPSGTYPAVDFAVIGNGAGGNASQAAALPSAALCPKGTLNWAGAGGLGGFATVAIGPLESDPTGPSQLTCTFYDETGAALHSFTKLNPRKGGKSDPPSAGGKPRLGGGAGADTSGIVGALGLLGIGAVMVAAYMASDDKDKEGGKDKAPAAPPAAVKKAAAGPPPRPVPAGSASVGGGAAARGEQLAPQGAAPARVRGYVGAGGQLTRMKAPEADL